MSTEFDNLVDQQREALTATFAEKHRQLLTTTQVFKQSLQASTDKGWHTHEQLWNVGIYVNINAHDLSVLVLQLCFERDDWTRKLAARHVALLIYEIAEDMRQLLGRRIRDPLATLGLLPQFDTLLRNARGPLDRFWDSHAGNLNQIRRTAAAHRDLDGLRLLDVVETINVQQTIDLGLELGRIMNNIGGVIQAILTASSQIRPPELRSSNA